MKTILIFVFTFIFCIDISAKIKWEKDLNQAKQLANQSGKPYILVCMLSPDSSGC